MIHFSKADGMADDRELGLDRPRNGALLIGIDSGGLTRYDNQQFSKVAGAEGLRVTGLGRPIRSDSESAFWIGSGSGQLYRYAGTELRQITSPLGPMPRAPVSDIELLPD